MIINYKEEFEKSSYKNEVPEQLFQIKQDKKQVDSQIRLLQNRIYQLQSIEKQQQKQIKNKKQKIIKLQDVYQFKEQMQDYKQNYQERSQDNLKDLQYQALHNKLSQEKVLNEVQQMVLQQKQMENNRVKLQTQQNEQEIIQYRNQVIKERKDKAQIIQNEISNSQLSINKYWEKRVKNYGKQKIDEIKKFQEDKQQRSQILNQLLCYESIHLQKLQNSSRNISQLDAILSDTKNIKNPEFLSNYITPMSSKRSILLSNR